MMVDHMPGNEPGSVGARFGVAMASGDPDRVAAALRELTEVLPPREPVPPPAPEVLDAFPDGAPGEVVRDYIWVVAHYRPFDPPLASDQAVRWWTEAVVRHPDGAAALQVVLYLAARDPPPDADPVADIISYLAARGVRPGTEEQGVEYLARYLLDDSQTYARAVRPLAAWKGRPVLDGVLHRVAPYIHAEDRAGLGL